MNLKKLRGFLQGKIDQLYYLDKGSCLFGGNGLMDLLRERCEKFNLMLGSRLRNLNSGHFMR